MGHREYRGVLAAVAGVSLSVGAGAQCPILFAAPVSVTAGSDAAAIAVADFNDDGKQDMVVANFGVGTISALLGVGDGTFQPAMHFTAFLGPISVVAGDWNGDGMLDIATANLDDNSVSTMRGNGDGTFQPAMRYSVGSFPVSVATGDLNGDAMPDLVVANQGSGQIMSLLNEGGGVFGAPLIFETTIAGLLVVSLGDLTGNGVVDAVATIPGSGLVAILFGRGDGEFDGPMTYAAGTMPLSVAIGDVSGDGNVDVVVSNQATAGASVMLGVGDGTFMPRTAYGGGSGARRSVAIADLNGDCNPDIALAGGTGFATLRGNGDGTFQTAMSVAAGTNLGFVAAGDFNGDGKPELAASNDNTTSVFVLRNTGVSAAITEQPEGQSVAEGGTAIFGVTASGAISYRWRRDGMPIQDSRAVEGATTPNLSISGVSAADQGVYDVQIGAACGGGVTSRPVLMIVASAATCPGDTNGDGVINFVDLNAVVSVFNSVCR